MWYCSRWELGHPPLPHHLLHTCICKEKFNKELVHSSIQKKVFIFLHLNHNKLTSNIIDQIVMKCYYAHKSFNLSFYPLVSCRDFVLHISSIGVWFLSQCPNFLSCEEHVVYAKWMSMMSPLDVLNVCVFPFLKVGSMESYGEALNSQYVSKCQTNNTLK